MFDLVIIGMGSAGATAAELAAHLDLSVAVVERDRVGSDVRWSDSIPSKALVATARAAHTMRTADRLGLTPVEPTVDLARVWRRVRGVQAEIVASAGSPQRLRDLGVEFLAGEARVTATDEVTVTSADGSTRALPTRFVLVCTGSSPGVIDVPGLPDGSTYTTDDFFELDTPPASVAVIGGGPTGVEMAQALRRLGVTATIFEQAPTLLPTEDPTLVARLTEIMEGEGVVVHCAADVRRVEAADDGSVVHAVVGNDGRSVAVPVHGILLAVGRTPNASGLGLEELGVMVDEGGIRVDGSGRTSVRSVYAVGDVTNGFGSNRLLGNAAGQQSMVAVRDMFFPGRGSAATAVPSCVFTDPELARVGLTVEEAEATFGVDADVWRFDLTHNDRARTDAVAEGGFVIVTGKGKVVGAHVLAPGAGELIHELAIATSRELRVDELAELVHVYPTIAGGIGQLSAEAAYEKAHRLRWLMKRRDRSR